mgnify:CR=1 FL=1
MDRKTEIVNKKSLFIFDLLIMFRVVLNDIINIFIILFFPAYLLIQLLKTRKNDKDFYHG